MKIKLLEYTPNPEKVIAMAAKLCYSPVGVEEIEENLTPEKVEKFLNMLMGIGHASPVEHINFTFAVEGISRTCSHQIVRHRIASFSQQSQRYVPLLQFEYIIPPKIAKIPNAKKRFIQAMEEDQKAYSDLVQMLMEEYIYSYLVEENDYYSADIQQDVEFMFKAMGEHKKELQEIEKKAIEDARYVFPNACETKMVFTMNARSLFNFFKHRCCERAQWEIRELATAMLREVRKVAPIIFKNMGPSCLSGSCPEGNMTCGKIVEIREKFKSL